MKFDIERWLSDRDVFNCLVSKGFRIMDDLDGRERNKVLREILRMNDLDFVQELVCNGLVCRETNPLSHAIDLMPSYGYDNDNIVRFLVESGCSVNHPGPADFFEADDAYDPDCNGPPAGPLLVAINSQCIKVTAFLLEQGAVIGRDELLAAGQTLNGDLVNILEEVQTDFNSEGAAILRGALDPVNKIDDDAAPMWLDFVKRLLDAGAYPNNTSYDGSNCGHHFVKIISKESYIPREIHREMFDLLIEYGLDINAENDKGETVLHQFDWKNVDLLEILLNKGSNPNSRERICGTVTASKMCNLIREGDLTKFHELIDILVQHEADLTVGTTHLTNIFTALLSVQWKCYIQSPIKHLLCVAEMGLLSNDELAVWLQDDDSSTAIPLMQAGCSYKCLLDRLAIVAIKNCSYVADDFDFEGFAACIDPSYDFQKALDSIARYLSRTHQSPDYCYSPCQRDDFSCSSGSYAKSYPLRCLAVYSLRNQILKANGNRSIIPRARKLPLPQCMIEMVTLECYKMADEQSSRPDAESSEDE